MQVPYRAENNRVWKGDSVAVTVWNDNIPENKLRHGESWLDMRKRTEPDRIRVEQEAKENAVVICALLNMRGFQ